MNSDNTKNNQEHPVGEENDYLDGREEFISGRGEPGVFDIILSGADRIVDEFIGEIEKEAEEEARSGRTHTLLYRLIWELVITFFFSSAGFPMFLRPNKTYAVFRLLLTVLAVLLALFLHKYWLFIWVGFHHFFDFASAVMRLTIYLRGKRASRGLIDKHV